MGKDLTEVRSSQRTLIPDAEDWGYYELPALGFGFLRRSTSCIHAVVRGIARKEKQEPRHRFRDLSRCLNETHLRHAFSKMNKKVSVSLTTPYNPTHS
jgi:RNA-directed DNA polymerase